MRISIVPIVLTPLISPYCISSSVGFGPIWAGVPETRQGKITDSLNDSVCVVLSLSKEKHYDNCLHFDKGI